MKGSLKDRYHKIQKCFPGSEKCIVLVGLIYEVWLFLYKENPYDALQIKIKEVKIQTTLQNNMIYFLTKQIDVYKIDYKHAVQWFSKVYL